MEQKYCLNCEAPVSGNFCSNCGQRTNTHRLTFRHFVEHDLIHGVWHMDKGVLFTLKEMFVRPGLAAKDYIAGKRVRYYNIFYLLLLVIALNIVVVHFTSKGMELKGTGDMKGMAEALSTYVKLFVLSIIPLWALNSWIIFRKLKFNYAEHNIIAGFALLGSTAVNLLNSLLRGIFPFEGVVGVAYIIKSILMFISIFFPVWAYYLATKSHYKTWGFGWRMICFYLFFLIEVCVLILLYVIIFHSGEMNGAFEFTAEKNPAN